jgi:hypothetical protein
LAPRPKRAEDRRAERAGDKGQGKDRERQHHARQAIDEREEQLREHQHRGDGVDEEVEEFRGAADDHAQRDLARSDAVRVGVHPARVAFQT